MSEQCSAYRDGKSICANGFFQIPACRQEIKCFVCGEPSKRLPYCLREELPKHMVSEDGNTIFAGAVERGAI